MPSLTVPISIWLDATPGERDAFYLQAGFDPNLPVIDNGTDSMTVRFRQEPVPFIPAGRGGGDPNPIPGAGDDLRDFRAQDVSLTGDNAVTDEFGVPIAAGTGVALEMAGRALKIILGGGGGRLTAATWNSLPAFVRTVLVQAGIGIGAMIAFNGDIPFITLPGQGNGLERADGSDASLIEPFAAIDIQVGRNPLQPVQVVGTWVANGVTFYRLADGKLAVQNKRGRWKVWRPKRPIVLYADGASSLKTMLRADKALNKQAKKIAAMLNRRAPRRKTSKADPQNLIIQGKGRIIDVD